MITPWYPTRQSPVTGAFVREQAKAVDRFSDVAVFHIACRNPGLKGLWTMEKETNQSICEGIEAYRIWYRNFPLPVVSYFSHLWSVLQAFRHLLVRGFRPNIIHAHVYEGAVPAVIIGKIHKIPVVVTEHSSKFPRESLTRFDKWKARMSFRLSELVMPVSQFLQQSIEAYDVKARFRIIRNVADPKVFYPESSAEPKRPLKRLLVVGLLKASHVKGLPDLFKALTLLQARRDDWHVDIVGDGPARAAYEDEVRELALTDKVTFHGLRTKRQVAEHMRHSDLFVVSSSLETSSVAAAEALLTGLPVVTTRCGGPEEFINDHVGLTVPCGDAEALCSGLSQMLDQLRRFSSTYISAYGVSLFSPDSVGQQLQEVYAEYLET